MNPSRVEIKGISKKFGAVEVLRGIDLDIEPGKLVCLLGPSGCGKSTLLRILAGFEAPTDGAISIGGRDVTAAPSKKRDIAMVFQNFALYPHMSVEDNISAPLVMSRLSFLERQPIFRFLMPSARRIRRDIRASVLEVANLLQIDKLLSRKPSQLSGGQKQRVAIGRAIIRKPLLFLMDEPLSSLDAGLRAQMRGELTALQKRLGVTTIFVTHDQTEAMTMADLVVVMSGGSVIQAGTPREIFENPAHIIVAKFLGSPSINIIESRISDGNVLNIAGATFKMSTSGASAAVSAGIRPEDLMLSRKEPVGEQCWNARIERTELLGHEALVFVTMGEGRAQEIVARVGSDFLKEVVPGEPIFVTPRTSKIKIFDVDGKRRNVFIAPPPSLERHAREVAK